MLWRSSFWFFSTEYFSELHVLFLPNKVKKNFDREFIFVGTDPGFKKIVFSLLLV